MRVYAMKLRGIEFKIPCVMYVCIRNCQNEEGVCVLKGPTVVQYTMDKVKLIRSGLKAAQDKLCRSIQKGSGV